MVPPPTHPTDSHRSSRGAFASAGGRGDVPIRYNDLDPAEDGNSQRSFQRRQREAVIANSLPCHDGNTFRLCRQRRLFSLSNCNSARCPGESLGKTVYFNWQLRGDLSTRSFASLPASELSSDRPLLDKLWFLAVRRDLHATRFGEWHCGE
jgi:hypothetical protein